MTEWLNGVPVVRASVLRIEGDNIWEPSALTAITAAGGITPTNPIMRIQGSGGAVAISANPQIAAGVDGQVLVIEGGNDTNTVTIADGNGLHLHGGSFVMADQGSITLIYNATLSQWQESSRNSPASEKSWTFDSPAGSSGTFYFGGYYAFGVAINDFDPAINWGTANISYAAHFMIVTGAIAGDEITITVTGTSINDSGTRQAADTETITIPSATAANTFYETAKKWIGTIAIEVTAGTAINCDYGWCKYWDNNNTNFRIVGIEATWLAGAADNTPNISLLHHRSTGWTYGAGGTPTLPAAVVDMNADHNTEIKTANGENGAWKRDNLNTAIGGGDSNEGTIIQVVTSANKTFELGNILLRVRSD